MRKEVMDLHLNLKIRWIKKMEGNKVKVVKAEDPNFMKTIERALTIGEPVLLQVS